ncbi:Pollen allergen ole e 6 [Corchorus olitorius]|uniref:Pollen allergen ole e 6 n=1 Tax=Corchorus olitorius TaxID=93759 RepID=A0A1R3K2X3_9ROSI|nr:Pollen allergen ole e 6 [Corchorus olitorius]
MANKFVAVFLVCIVVAATMCVEEVGAHESKDHFSKCFKECDKECHENGHGNTFCEMKCDEDCGAKEAEAKLNIKF